MYFSIYKLCDIKTEGFPFSATHHLINNIIINLYRGGVRRKERGEGRGERQTDRQTDKQRNRERERQRESIVRIVVIDSCLCVLSFHRGRQVVSFSLSSCA